MIHTARKPVVHRHTSGGTGASETNPVDERPRSVYEMLTRRMLEDLREDVAEVKGRVNTLLWLTAGAVVLDLITKWVK